MYRPDTSPGSGVVPSGEGQSPLDRLLDAAASASVYDVILAVIPLVLTGSLALGWTVGASLTASVSAGSAVALLFVGYGLFGAPPQNWDGGH